MKDTSEIFLNGDEICKILVAAAGSGVLELEYGPLRICFGARASAPPPSVVAPGAAPPEAALPPAELAREQHKAEEASLLDEEIRVKEERMANLILEDPLAFEEMLAGGELEGAKDGSGEEALDL